MEPRQEDVEVVFNLIPDPGNDAETGEAELDEESIETDEEGNGSVTLELPVYGGAKFKVGGKTEHQPEPVESGQVTVWRKVFYHVTEMEPAPDRTSFTAPTDMISAVAASFEDVFFELAPGTTSHGTTPYRAHLTAAQRDELAGQLEPTVEDDRSPFKMNIVMIDAADIVGEQEFTGTSTDGNVSAGPFRRWPHEDTVIRAEYERTLWWSNLTNVAVVADSSGSGNVRVTATIPDFEAGSSVNWRVRVRYQRGNAGGWGGTTGTLYMCIGYDRRRNAATPTGADLQPCLTHETGHALGLVPTDASWRDTDPRDDGYSLRHCGYQDSATPSQPRCVMWYMLPPTASGPRTRFCSSDGPNDCAHFLKRTDYEDIDWI